MPKNCVPRQITLAEMAPHIHYFHAGENKVMKIAEWLTGWIKSSLESGKIKFYDFLPSKSELAFHIGVSKGTIQNAFRLAEDMGFIESKQKIGSYIKDSAAKSVAKLTSKREVACSKLKAYFIKNKIKTGNSIGTLKQLSKTTELSQATIRIAINTLIAEGILEKQNKNIVLRNTNFQSDDIHAKTLVDKIAEKIKEYISISLKDGERLPSNPKLAEMYNVSMKTIHDSIKILTKEGLIMPRRGKYGTQIVISGKKTESYEYEKAEAKIRNYISENCEEGAKLPSIRDLAKEFNVSTKTIKKALDNLAEEGYVTFLRGRQGGTFVTDIPQTVNEAYTWLALNPNYISESHN